MQVKAYFTASIAEEMNTSEKFKKFVLDSICRHLSGDWGDLCREDKETNNSNPLFALSAYKAPDGRKIWIKQDYDAMGVLFPSEY